MAQWSLVLAWALAASACSTVRPWERAALAQRPMTPGSGDEICRSEFSRHVFDVREGGTGGSGIAGGGCGCN